MGKGEESIGRSASRDLDLVCRWEGCGKVCLSKGGLTLHQKSVLLRAPEDRVRFSCDRCRVNLETQSAKTNHEKTCTGGGVETEEGGGGGSVGIVRGGYLGGTILGILGVVGGEGGVGRGGFIGDWRECEICGGMQSATNLARHRARCRQVRDPLRGT